MSTGNVSFNGTTNKIPIKDLENMARYYVGSNVTTPEETLGQAVGGLLLFEGAATGFKGAKWLSNSRLGAYDATLTGEALRTAKKAADPFKNGEGFKTAFTNTKNAFGQVVETTKTNLNSTKQLLSNGAWKNANTYKNIWKNTQATSFIKSIQQSKIYNGLDDIIKAGTDAAAVSKATQAKAAYDTAIQMAGKVGAHPETAMKVANKYLTQAEALAHGQIKATSKLGKIFKPFSKISGAIKNFATKSPLTAKLLRGLKGNGLFVAISGGIELISNVIPTFKEIGVESGVKQVVKSTVKVAADVGAFAGGMKIGATVGAAIGGPVGAVIGAVGGAVLGGVFSWIASKITKKVLGPDELEKHREEQAMQIAKEANNNSEAANELMTLTTQKLQAEGVATEDAQIAYNSLASNQQANTASGVTNGYSYNPFSGEFTNNNQSDFKKQVMAMQYGLT